MSNRVTIDQLSELTMGEVSSLPLDQLAALVDDVAERKAALSSASEILTAALEKRFGASIRDAMREQNKDTGTVRVEAGDFVAVADVPKKVEWNDAKLRAAVKQLTDMGEDTAEYVDTKLTVSEAKFKAWPTALKKLFEPARTVKTGKLTIKLEALKREAA